MEIKTCPLETKMTLLDKECISKIAYTKKSYKYRKEILILSYIRSNVKEGDIFYNVGYTEELEFKKCLDTGIVFWNKTFNKEEIYSPLEFLNLNKGRANNMSKMQYVAGILGLNLLDQFQIVGDNSLYMINDKDIVVKADRYNWVSAPDVLYGLLTGELKIKKTPWKPDIGDKYYVLNLAQHPITSKKWYDTSLDSYIYDNGLMFRTEEEAQNMLNEILSFVKKERGITNE